MIPKMPPSGWVVMVLVPCDGHQPQLAVFTRLKEISTIMEKQHNLLKLVIQKMEITSEAEEHDGPQLTPAPPSEAQLAYARSRWVPLVKAVTRKK